MPSSTCTFIFPFIFPITLIRLAFCLRLVTLVFFFNYPLRLRRPRSSSSFVSSSSSSSSLLGFLGRFVLLVFVILLVLLLILI